MKPTISLLTALLLAPLALHAADTPARKPYGSKYYDTPNMERLGFRGGKAPDTFIISSREAIHFPEELKAAGVKATDKPSRLIEDFSRGWQDWYRLEWGNSHAWVATIQKEIKKSLQP